MLRNGYSTQKDIGLLIIYWNIPPRADCINLIAAGVNSTIINDGNINNPIGISILMGAL